MNTEDEINKTIKDNAKLEKSVAQNRRSVNMVLLGFILVFLVLFMMSVFLHRDMRNSVHSAEATKASVFTHASSVNPYREVIDYYRLASEYNTFGMNDDLSAKIEAAMQDDTMSIKELWDIRETRKAQLETAAFVALINNDDVQPMNRPVSHYVIDMSDKTNGHYQSVLEFKIAVSNMSDLDDAKRNNLLKQIEVAIADKEIDSNEYEVIEDTYYDIEESSDKARLIKMIADQAVKQNL